VDFFNAPNDHFVILHDMETSTASYVDKKPSSGDILAQHIFKAILRWVDMLDGIHLKVRPAYCSFTFLKQLPRLI
jgi:hypothetical protein